MYTGQIENFTTLGATPDADQDFYLTEPTDVHNLESITTDIFDNGNFIKVEKKDLIIQLQEENTNNLKENYDIEVFMSSSSPLIETRQLMFNKHNAFNYNTEDASFYITLNVDKEISDELLDKVGIRDLTALGPSRGSSVVSTREYFVKDLYKPATLPGAVDESEEPCE